jgi:D-serine deaminase-like pyridoxal phosphate-dependent protein
VGLHKIDEILQLRQAIKVKSASANLKLLVDNVVQAEALQQKIKMDPISVFIKIDGGYNRAGLHVDSPLLPELIKTINRCDQIVLHGVYTHAGLSYKSTNASMTESHLKGELQCVDDAAQVVLKILKEEKNTQRHRSPLILSVGSTPTAHAFTNGGDFSSIRKALHGELELHPGNYAFLDLQQVSTGAVPYSDGVAPIDRCAMTVLTTVISVYPGRASSGIAHQQSSLEASPSDEALCDAGGIALSKDTGQFSGHGHVIWPRQYVGWEVGRIAQEHGVLTMRQGNQSQWSKEWGKSLDNTTSLVKVGDNLHIVPQHACMVAAAHPWFFIYDSLSAESSSSLPLVDDVWIPWKGW